MQVVELSDRGDDTGKGGLKDAVRYGVLGVGSVPLLSWRRPEEETDVEQGCKGPFEKRTSGTPGRAESERMFQCFSHLNTRTPTEPLI